MSIWYRVRSVFALLAGYAAWLFTFFALVFGVAFVWPTLGETGQQYWQEQRFDIFPASTLVFFQFAWLPANFAAGLAAQTVGKSQRVVWIGAGLLFAYFVYNHWWALWGELPDWYNVLVPLPVIPMVWLGACVARRFV